MAFHQILVSLPQSFLKLLQNNIIPQKIIGSFDFPSPSGTELPFFKQLPPTGKNTTTLHPNLSPGELCGGGEMIHTLELVHHTMDVLSSVGGEGPVVERWVFGWLVVVAKKNKHTRPTKTKTSSSFQPRYGEYHGQCYKFSI